ncbi:BPIB4 protein, partial [Alectura lathami]|nr:BPIB4 protein [Alectura lathami]
MKLLTIFGVVLFCGLLLPTQGHVPGLSCAISPQAMEKVLSDAMIKNGLLQQHLQGLVLPNVMGEGGLLSSPIIITSLHLEAVLQTKLSLALLPGVGIQLTIFLRLHLVGNCLIGLLSEIIDITVDATVTVNVKNTNFEIGLVQIIVDDCFCVLGTVKIKLLSGLLPLSVREIVVGKLTVTLPGLLCPVLDIVINLVNMQLLATLNVVIPIDVLGTIHYHLASTPFVTGLYLGIDLDGTVKLADGTIIPHDSQASTLPPLTDKTLAIGLRQGFLSVILSVLLRIQPYTFDCTPDTFSGAKLLAEAIVGLFPPGCSVCSVDTGLSVRVECFGNPLIILEDNKATVQIILKIQVFIKRADGSILVLLVVKADLALDVHLSIGKRGLLLALSLGSSSLFLESSEVGISDISKLNPHLIKLLVEVCLPRLNAAVAIGVPLPDLFGIPLLKADIRI